MTSMVEKEEFISEDIAKSRGTHRYCQLIVSSAGNSSHCSTVTRSKVEDGRSKKILAKGVHHIGSKHTI
jgi:hypothetical protein